MNKDHSAVFEIAHKYCILDSSVDYEGYSTPSKGFLSTVVVDIMIIWIKFAHPIYLRSYDVDVHSCRLLFDHFQFTLIHGPDIPGSYAVLFFTASEFTFTTRHIHSRCQFHFGSTASLFLELFLYSFPVAYWTPTNLGGSSSRVISFCLFILFMGLSRQEYWSS